MRFVYFGLDFFAKWSELEEALEENSIFRLHMVKQKPVGLDREGRVRFGFYQLQKNYSNEENVSFIWGQKSSTTILLLWKLLAYQEICQFSCYPKYLLSYLLLKSWQIPSETPCTIFRKALNTWSRGKMGGFFAERFFKLHWTKIELYNFILTITGVLCECNHLNLQRKCKFELVASL